MLVELLAAAVVLAAPPGRPNILFIMADDHGKQAISCYGSTLTATPGIDRIAREGIRFDRSSVTNAICGPSRAVILTGKHSHVNGFTTNEQRFDNGQQTYPKLLRAAGYRTEVVGKWHLESDPTGFDHFDVLVGQGDYWNAEFSVDGVRQRREGHVTDVIHRETIARLDALAERAEQGTPFALIVHHKAPHRNWMPQPKYYGLFSGAPIPEPATLFDDYAGRSVASSMQKMLIARDLAWEYDLKVDTRRLFPNARLAQLDQWMTNELARLPQSVRDGVRDAYAADNGALYAAFGGMDARAVTSWKFQRYAKDYLRTAQGVDDSVGGILAELDRLGIADNTLVIYTSDQGWFLGEHGWFDKRWAYEESLRTPLVMRWPTEIPAGSASGALVQNLDFAPTILAAAGVEIPPDMQGVSMLPLVRVGGVERALFRDAVYYRFEESKGPHTVPRHEAVVTARHKLIRFLDRKDAQGAPVIELYDLERDPDERTSLAGRSEASEVEREMRRRLDEVRARYRVPEESDSAPITKGAEKAPAAPSLAHLP